MIAIKNADKQTALQLCEQMSLPPCMVLEMTDRGQALGYACAVCDGEEATVHCLEAPEGALTDALLRAVLNALRSDGAKTAKIVADNLQKHMIQKGYFVDSLGFDIEIADFFAKTCCNG